MYLLLGKEKIVVVGALHSDWLVLSASEVNPDPAWLPKLINKGFDMYCGFDSDKTGDAFANKND